VKNKSLWRCDSYFISERQRTPLLP